eukprot:Gb_05879 [translate_table: standard]
MIDYPMDKGVGECDEGIDMEANGPHRLARQVSRGGRWKTIMEKTWSEWDKFGRSSKGRPDRGGSRVWRDEDGVGLAGSGTSLTERQNGRRQPLRWVETTSIRTEQLGAGVESGRRDVT